MAWTRTHVRLPSSPPSIPPPYSFLRKPSRLVGLCVITTTFLTTYWLHASEQSASGRLDVVDFGVEQAVEGGVMEDRNVRAVDGLVQSAFLSSEDADGSVQTAASVQAVGLGEGKGAATVPPAPASLVKPVELLPVCKRTVLFRFAGLHGFGSEITLLLRIAALAEHYGYSLILDSSSWNYSSFEDYFNSPSLPFPSLSSPCRPPPETTKRFKLVITMNELLSLSSPQPANPPSFTPNWTKRNHIVWSSRDMDGMDASILRLFVEGPALETLHFKDLRRLRSPSPAVNVGFLSPEETLPSVFEPALSSISALAKVLWSLNEEMQKSAKLLEAELGVLTEKVRGKKQAEELLIAIHVRLGDKFLEADGRIGPVQFAPEAVAAAPPRIPSAAAPGLNSPLISSYFAAAIDSVNSLLFLPSAARLLSSLPSSATDADRTESLLHLVRGWTGRPTLALMSDDSAAVQAFRQHPLADFFRIVGTAEIVAPTPLPPVEARSLEAMAEEVKDDLGSRGEPARRKAGEGKNRLDVVKRHPGPFQHNAKLGSVKWHHAPIRKVIPPGFNELTFNALPLSSRLASTKLFVRDLTVLSRHADAIVMTGSSNVGRLMALLFEAARVERGVEGRREMRSLDTRWFPTSKFS